MVKRVFFLVAIFLLPVILACGTSAPEVVEQEVAKAAPAKAAPAKAAPAKAEKAAEPEKKKLGDVIKDISKPAVSKPTAVPPPETVTGPVGSVISATSDMAEMGFDPALDNTSNVKAFFDELNIFGIQQDTDGQLIGGAASKWEISPDQLSWIYTVREGVKFHNGETLTPEDFSWSWNRQIMSPEAESSAAVWAPRVEYIQVEGNTVVVRTKEPEPLMPLWWPSYEGTQAGAVLSKVEFDKTGAEGIRNNPVGGGSFKFVERSRGEFIKLEAFEDHYCCVPGFKELTVLELPEIATRLALLKTGGVDLIEAVPAIKPDLVKDGFEIYSGRGAQSSSMWFPYQNIEGSPFFDIRVREAFNIAIDRATIVDRLYAGEGGATPSFLSGPGSFGFNADLPGYPFDPARAKQLMIDAGYGDGFTIRLVTYKYDADFPDMPVLAQAIGGYLQDELGITFEVQVMEWGSVKALMVNMLQEVCGGDVVWCHGEEVAPELAAIEPYTLIVRGNDTRFHALRQNVGYMHPQGRRPFIQIPWVAEELDNVGAEFDFEKQRTMFEEYNRMVYDEFIQGFMIYSNSVFAVSDRIGSWKPITGRTYPNNQWTLQPK